MTNLALNPQTTAILVIDLQKGIVGLDTSPVTSRSVVANAANLLKAARRAGAQPILVHVGASADSADWPRPPSDADARRPAALPPDWSELVPELERQEEDLVVFKRQWGAFYGTDLDLQLRRRGLTTLVLCGIATEFGVESTARDAYERGYHQILVSDAMSGVTEQSHNNALQRIFPRLGQVRTTGAVVSALER